MRKIDRLFEIVQLLRGRRLRTAQFLAAQLGVSTRTIYRDIQGLMASGVPIEGERGIGYLVQQPIELPPLKFNALELQTIKFGLDFVRGAATPEMAQAAEEIFLKINDVLPNKTNQKTVTPLMRVYFELSAADKNLLSTLRAAIDGQQKLTIEYRAIEGAISTRIIRPLSLEYWGKIWTLTTWCELRNDFRVFRLDHIEACEMTGEVFMPEGGKKFEDYLEIVNEKNKNYPHS